MTCEATTIRKFDLNVEEILENWEISHAVREIIANALMSRNFQNRKKSLFLRTKAGGI